MVTGRLQPASDVVARRLDDELVLVNLQTNRIYTLNRTGARFWELLADGNDRDAIEAQLHTEFDVDRATLSAEVDELLADLARVGLVDRSA